MAVSITGFRAYARLSDPAFSEDGEAQTADLCLRAALDHARSSGIPVDRLTDSENAKFELYIYALALHWFDNRGFVSGSQSYSADEYTRRMMAQMWAELESEGW